MMMEAQGSASKTRQLLPRLRPLMTIKPFEKDQIRKLPKNVQITKEKRKMINQTNEVTKTGIVDQERLVID